MDQKQVVMVNVPPPPLHSGKMQQALVLGAFLDAHNHGTLKTNVWQKVMWLECAVDEYHVKITVDMGLKDKATLTLRPADSQ